MAQIEIAAIGGKFGNQRPPHIELNGKMNPITCQALYHAGNSQSIGVMIPAITGRYVNTEKKPNTKRLIILLISSRFNPTPTSRVVILPRNHKSCQLS